MSSRSPKRGAPRAVDGARRWALPSFLVMAACATVPVRIAAQTAEDGRGRLSVYLAVDVGRQSVIAGALVDGLDVLAQASRWVGSVSLGVRADAPFGTAVGFDVGLGRFGGDLRHQDGTRELDVAYRGTRQRHWNAWLGQSLGPGRRTTVFAYLSEASRDFEVEVKDRGTRYRQQDGQGLLRYGLGVERGLTDLFALRVTAGSSRADFGSRPTNFTPRRPLDFSLGGVLHWPRDGSTREPPTGSPDTR